MPSLHKTVVNLIGVHFRTAFRSAGDIHVQLKLNYVSQSITEYTLSCTEFKTCCKSQYQLQQNEFESVLYHENHHPPCHPDADQDLRWMMSHACQIMKPCDSYRKQDDIRRGCYCQTGLYTLLVQRS